MLRVSNHSFMDVEYKDVKIWRAGIRVQSDSFQL